MEHSETDKRQRVAVTLTLIFPGAGQFYLGRRSLGCVIGFLFGAFFLTASILFLAGASHYFKLVTDGSILEGDKLEQLATVFHPKWLIGLAVAGVAVYALAFADLARKPTTPPPPLPPRLPER